MKYGSINDKLLRLEKVLPFRLRTLLRFLEKTKETEQMIAEHEEQKKQREAPWGSVGFKGGHWKVAI